MTYLSSAPNDDNHAVHKVVTLDGSQGDHARVCSVNVSKNAKDTDAKLISVRVLHDFC